VVIGVNAAVDVQNFTLDAPARVVVDLKGASLEMSQRTYDRISRGGITNIRYSQFRSNVVRVVIEMDAKHPYDVKRSDTEVRITVSGGKTADYSSWSSNKNGYVASPTPPQARPVSATADAKKAPATVATKSPMQTETPKVVAQVESQSTQAEPEYDQPATVRAPVKAARTDDLPVALFSQAQQSQQPLINVTFQDTDIRDVIASFAAFSGRTIVVGKDVAGTVTAEIRNQPWDVALRAILQGQGLAASEGRHLGDHHRG